MANVWVKDSPVFRDLLSKIDVSSPVAVWLNVSRFVQVTFVPLGTVRGSGAKVKFAMSTSKESLTLPGVVAMAPVLSEAPDVSGLLSVTVESMVVVTGVDDTFRGVRSGRP